MCFVEYALLTGFLPVRVQVDPLEQREEHLDRAAVVGVGSRHDHLDALSRQVLPRRDASVVWRAVDHEDRVLSPVFALFRQLFHELGDEQAEDLGVGLHGVHREVDAALRVDGREEAHPGPDVPLLDGVRLRPEAPLLPAEVRLVQPALVDVDDASP